jgi:hypothetical protein
LELTAASDARHHAAIDVEPEGQSITSEESWRLISGPKRPGLAWQDLRASAALLLEWLRLCLRHGWLRISSPSQPQRTGPLDDADLATSTSCWEAAQMGLDLPYGRAAAISGVIHPVFKKCRTRFWESSERSHRAMHSACSMDADSVHVARRRFSGVGVGGGSCRERRAGLAARRRARRDPSLRRPDTPGPNLGSDPPVQNVGPQ